MKDYRIARLHGTALYRIEVYKQRWWGCRWQWCPYREGLFIGKTDDCDPEFSGRLAAVVALEKVRAKENERVCRSIGRWEPVRS